MTYRQSRSFSLLLVLIMLAVGVITTTACQKTEQGADAPDLSQSVIAASSWLIRENQGADGGFGIDFDSGEQVSNAATTLDAILAISAAGYNAGELYCGADNSAIGYLEANASDLIQFAATTGGANGKTILALDSANLDARNFAGHDFVAQLMEQFVSSGTYNNQDAFNQALAILALTAVDEPVPDIAIEWLESQQSDDGSWDDGFGTDRNVDATAMAVMAILAAQNDPLEPAVAAALEFLAESQLATGGWEYGQDFGENANSTALVIQMLLAAGENYLDEDGDWANNGQTPSSALLTWQSSNGAFQADFGQGRLDNLFATLQAIPALSGDPYPIPSSTEKAKDDVDCTGQ